MKRIAVIADMVSSKRIKNRADVQKKLQSVFRRINKNSGVISPYTITLGDEFQAVYDKADFLFRDIWQIIYSLYPVKIRFSIGVGEITTRINRKQAIGMDGPAFYNARKGLEELKNTGYLFNISSDDENNIEMYRQSLYLISHFSESWKETRIKILTMLYEGLTPKEISNRMAVTDKAVYKNITSGALYVVLDLTTEIAGQINKSLQKK